jgi:hypothetical protein
MSSGSRPRRPIEKEQIFKVLRDVDPNKSQRGKCCVWSLKHFAEIRENFNLPSIWVIPVQVVDSFSSFLFLLILPGPEGFRFYVLVPQAPQKVEPRKGGLRVPGSLHSPGRAKTLGQAEENRPGPIGKKKYSLSALKYVISLIFCPQACS